MSRLLIKLPSRERPGVLLRAARLYCDLAADHANTRLLLSLDDDDATADRALVRMLEKLALPTTVKFGTRSTKIGAVNRDLPGDDPWDILLVASDDQWPVVRGYDNIIRDTMRHHFPDGDGGLWFKDGNQERICTQCVMTRTRYETLGNVYHPEYASYCADDEYTERGLADGKLVQVPVCLIRHQHHFFGGEVEFDDLYKHNLGPKEADKMLLNLRRAAGWP